jgi:predicted DsbA family dithiol-disulfide isomerase
VATPAFFIGTVRDDGGIDLVTKISGAVPPDVFHAAISELIPEQAQLP